MTTKREERPVPDELDVVKHMHQWSDEKLELELMFAEACVVETWPETIAWRDAIRAEATWRTEAKPKAKVA